jgi:hypothetical protein
MDYWNAFLSQIFLGNGSRSGDATPKGKPLPFKHANAVEDYFLGGSRRPLHFITISIFTK